MPSPTLHANPGNSFSLLYNPYQQAFLAARRQRLADGSRAFNRFALIAGRRGGKTLIGALAAVEEASVPNSLGWCVAPTYGDLHDYVIPAVMQVLPESWRKPGAAGWSAFHQTLTLVNGAQIAFRSADDPERMRGPGLNWLWLDEARKVSRLVWDTVKPALIDKRGAAFITTTPNGYDWVYHTFWKMADNPKYRRPGYWAVRYRTIDNPFITEEELEEARATTEDLWFKQEYEAEFVSFEGAIYGHRTMPCVLNSDEEVRQRFLPTWPTIPADLPVLIGLDPGADHPFAAVKIVATPKGLLVVQEYARRMSSYSDHAEYLQRWAHGHQDVRWAIDRTANQAQIELAHLGLTTSSAENSVVLGIQRVQAWLKTERIGFVAARVPMLLEELQTYRWKDTSNLEGEKGREQPFKVDDDLCDALRYAVMLWPELPADPPPRRGRDPEAMPPEMRWAWEREQRLVSPDDDGTTEWSHLEPAFDENWSPTGDMWAQ
jgi:hypothetical protein